MHETKSVTYKLPSYGSIIIHVYTSINYHLVSVYSIGCSRKIKIGKSNRFAEPMWIDQDIAMWNGRDGNMIKFKFYEAGCLLEVGVIKEGWVVSAMRAT
jgi:hypothetical protein